MARLRFPGRPGCRVDRVGIPYCADDVNESSDPALQFVANLRRGLQEFRQLCGESEVNRLVVTLTNQNGCLRGSFLRQKNKRRFRCIYGAMSIHRRIE